MGRFEDIVARNRQPFRLQGTRAMLLRGLFLVVILGLFLFTKWAMPPVDKRPGINVVPEKDPAIRGVKLYKVPATTK